MRASYRIPTFGMLLGGCLMIINLLLSPPGVQAQRTAPAGSIFTGEQINTQLTPQGWITLGDDLSPAPEIYGSFARFGSYISPAQELSTPTAQFRVQLDTYQPADSAIRFDLRVSANGTDWSAWEVGLESGMLASFQRLGRYVQYRATLLANTALPVVQTVQITPLPGVSTFELLQDQPAVAPTYRLHATRQGLVGRRTANGHIIKKRDRFVSLPCWCSLSSKGGSEYMVRLTYNGKSVVLPVYDVGPWNTRDNYWAAQEQRTFGDLRQGWPQDHAAYFDGHNGGRSGIGLKVRFPTAVDVGDGAWWDELGIRGDRAILEITYLWLGADPLAESTPKAEPPPQPQPAQPGSPEIMVDNTDPAFKSGAKVTWYDGTNCGANGHALWTYSTRKQSDSENWGIWQPTLPNDGSYEVFVSIPNCQRGRPNTESARYRVQHRDGTTEVVINQELGAGQWVSLGRFNFAAGDGGLVALDDLTNDSMRVVWFDAVKWV